jgi:hypothetical protein
MARDLFFKNVESNWARDCSETTAPTLSAQLNSGPDKRMVAIGILAGLIATAWTVPRLTRKLEVHRYRRSFADNLKTTQEIPTISMQDLVYGKPHLSPTEIDPYYDEQ